MFDEHDNHFKALNSELLREVARLDAVTTGGHTLADLPGWEAADEEEGVGQAARGRRLGGGRVAAPAAAAAAGAALLRSVAAEASAAPQAAPASGGPADSGGGAVAGAPVGEVGGASPSRPQGTRSEPDAPDSDSTQHAEEEMRRLGLLAGEEGLAQAVEQQLEELQGSREDQPPAAAAAAAEAQAGPAASEAGAVAADGGDVEMADALPEEGGGCGGSTQPGALVAAVEEGMCEQPGSSSPAAAAAQPSCPEAALLASAVQLAALVCGPDAGSSGGSGALELGTGLQQPAVAAGTAEAATTNVSSGPELPPQQEQQQMLQQQQQQHRLPASGSSGMGIGSAAAAMYALEEGAAGAMPRGPEEGAAVALLGAEEGAAAALLGAEEEDVATSTLRDTRAAIASLRAAAPAGEADQALSLVASVISNLLEHPGEARYRRLSSGNAAFSRRAGRCMGQVLQLLRLAGFSEVGGGGGGLHYTRGDPGLLWLVLSLVKDSM